MLSPPLSSLVSVPERNPFKPKARTEGREKSRDKGRETGLLGKEGKGSPGPSKEIIRDAENS
jgi:hypothetical protein